jgi:hypothetical protein
MIRKQFSFSTSSGRWSQFISAALLLISAPAAAGLFDAAVSGQTTTSDSATVAPAPAAEPQPTTASTEGAAEATGNGAAAGTAPTAAAPEPTAVERIVEKSGLTFDLNGHIRGDMFIGMKPGHSQNTTDDSPVEIKSGYGELGLKLKVSKAPYGDAFGEVRLQGGYLNDQHYLGQPSDTPPSGTDIGEFQTRVKLREAYVNFYGGSYFDLRFGYQIIMWGKADGINPTNNLTPIDLRVRSPEEDDRRLGNLALKAGLNIPKTPIRIEGVWVPMYAPSYMPKIGLSEDIVFDKPKYPDMDIAHGTYAAKIHLLLPQVEMSMSYLYGYSLQPGLSHSADNLEEVANQIATNNGQADPANYIPVDNAQVHIARTAYQHQVVGFDFSTDIAGKVGLRGEFAYKDPLDFKEAKPPYEDDYDYQVAVPFPELYYVLGIDKEFGNVSLIAQYVGKTVLKWKEAEENDEGTNMGDLNATISNALNGSSTTPVPNGTITGMENAIYRELALKNRLIQGQTVKIQHAFSGRVEWKALHDTLSLSAFGMVNFSTWEWLVYPKIAYNITDAMSVSVGGEIYQGPKDTLFGYIEEILSAGYTELKITF